MNQVITVEKFDELKQRVTSKVFMCPVGRCTENFDNLEAFVSHLIQEHPDRLRDVNMVQFLLTEEEMSVYH